MSLHQSVSNTKLIIGKQTNKQKNRQIKCKLHWKFTLKVNLIYFATFSDVFVVSFK